MASMLPPTTVSQAPSLSPVNRSRDWSAVLENLLQGAGAAFSLAGSGNPNWGMGGMQAMNDARSRQTGERAARRQDEIQQWTIDRQLKADSDAEAEKQAAATTWRGFIGQPDSKATPKFIGGAGSSQTHFQQPAAPMPSPMLDGRTPAQIDVLKMIGSYDPKAAMNMVGEMAFSDPKAPTVAGGMAWNATTGQFEPIPGWTEQQEAIARAKRTPPQPPQAPAEMQAYANDMKLLADAGKPRISWAEWKRSQSSGEFNNANTLRDEFSTLTKDFRTVQDAFSKIQSTSDSGAGDMSLLYSYVKLLDPGSVVRESEFATAAASGSYGERIQGLVQRVMTGERLPASLRQEFKAEAGNLFKAQKLGYDKITEVYTGLSNRAGVSPNDVIVPYDQPISGAPMIGDIQDGYRFKGGDPADQNAWEPVQ
jgi:hypothetical protein